MSCTACRFKEWTMRRYRLMIAGLLMVGAGAYLIFANPQALPLWFVWLVGPFFWYVGIAASVSGMGVALFLRSDACEKQTVKKKESRTEEIPVLPMRKLVPQLAPVCLTREIPAMGGFLL
jgi:hypothetical protein